MASGEQTSERGNRQASQAGEQACHERLECLPSSRIRPLLLSAAAAGLPARPSPRCWVHRLRAPRRGWQRGQGGIDVVRGVVADGRERGALTPFFRASIHREEKMPVPPWIPVVSVPPSDISPFLSLPLLPRPSLVMSSAGSFPSFLPSLSLSIPLSFFYFSACLSFSRSRVTRTMGPFWHGSYRCYARVGPPGGPRSDATESHEDCRGRTIAPE